MMISGTTKLLGIIGDPVEHSRSPVMQNAAIAKLGLDYIYVPFPVVPFQLETAIAGFNAIGVVGFNATIPHKQAIIPLLDRITPLAQSVGAVNTVWRQDNLWHGTNTDVAGFIAPLKALDRSWQDSTAIILGHGGAARAVVAGCHQLGFRRIVAIGRDLRRVTLFQQSWQNSPLKIEIEAHLWADLPDLISSADLLVNTTPIGMYPQVEGTPIDPELLTKCRPHAIAYDLIYTPSPTKFLSLAAQSGLRSIDGLEMLIYQGAAALELWSNRQLDDSIIDVMRQALNS
jgi:shikimate dehydrogenase